MGFETKSSIKAIVADVKIYVEKKIELASLEAQDKGAVLAAAVMSNVLGIALLLVGGFLLLFAAAIGLGYLFENMALGFLALALFFVAIGTYIYKTKRNLLKKKLEVQLSSFIQQTLNSAAERSLGSGASSDSSSSSSAEEEQSRPKAS